MDWLSAGAESLISFQARSRFQGKAATGHTPLKSSSLSGECPLYSPAPVWWTPLNVRDNACGGVL